MWAIIRPLLLIGMGFILLYPVIYMVTIAFRPTSQVIDPSIVWIPKSLTLENFITVFKIMNYGTALKNTLLIGIVSSVLQVAVCCIVGYGFARFKFKERDILFSLVLFTIIVPPQTIFLSSYLNFKNFDILGIFKLIGIMTGSHISLNLLDTPWIFYLTSATGMGIRAGLFIFIFRQFFRGMPKEFEDVAYIDGCGHFKTFVKIIIPNAGAPLLVSFLFSIVWYWNDYFNPAIYFNSTETVATALATLMSRIYLSTGGTDQFNYVVPMQTGSLLAILPIMLMYIILQRYFTESIERTGIVG
jgi:multiple sugar transport system permease protein